MHRSMNDYDDLPDAEVFEEFYKIVRQIPKGKVASYGQIAKMANYPEDARRVGHALAALEDSEVPWHRVVTASGKIAMPTRPHLRDRQRDLLLQEGVEFIDEYQVHMQRYDWQVQQVQADLFG
ncbi:MGMT family protein [Aliikangiella coralliicola]|uniref:Methyltransferase n=1 Tax=Aliikangiella coralliicola TaxID=2592383 RepID=A0A545UG22_9GAMM|nr:MGMT family protein [Aliikangiella coralliicola]TQV88343.1 methyltransferase [Aliikangiella coralliicola]